MTSLSTIRLVEPAFGSSLTELILELDYLRRKKLSGTTPAEMFFQLKDIFHVLESLGSARIEGNNTTLAEYIETKLERQQLEPFESQTERLPPSIQEIVNLEQAMTFIEQVLDESDAAPYKIDRAFVSQLHSMVVENLLPAPRGEGDATPGVYRKHDVSIQQSSHHPPDWIFVEEHMQALFDFINTAHGTQYDLLKVALAHHRFVWIHPFGNGNGRTVRLLTYAMLVRAGFHVHVGRILNPTAVFCGNRNDYYAHLAKADTATDAGLLEWCEYVLRGLKDEIVKIDKLLDYQYLFSEVLLPTISHALQQKYISETEANILRKAAQHQVIKLADVKEFFEGKVSQEISRHIRKLLDKKMLAPERDGARRYYLRFDNNVLLRSVMHVLDKEGFLPIKD
jgi:Fic family protein